MVLSGKAQIVDSADPAVGILFLTRQISFNDKVSTVVC